MPRHRRTDLIYLGGVLSAMSLRSVALPQTPAIQATPAEPYTLNVAVTGLPTAMPSKNSMHHRLRPCRPPRRNSSLRRYLQVPPRSIRHSEHARRQFHLTLHRRHRPRQHARLEDDTDATLRSQCRLVYEPQHFERNGAFHRIKLDSPTRGGVITTSSGYYAVP